MIRLIDIFFSLFLILILSPILLLISFFLKITGESEVFFLQERIGKKYKKFKVIKFVTMRKDSPNIGTGTITLKDDPRILPFGNFLRKFKINELPQLFNVIKGDMSFIGPRPLTKETFSFYSEEGKKEIIKIKPGLSGIGSIYFRNEEDFIGNDKKSVENYQIQIAPIKERLEIWYVENESFSLYIKLIFLTIWVIFFKNSQIYKKVLSIPFID